VQSERPQFFAVEQVMEFEWWDYEPANSTDGIWLQGPHHVILCIALQDEQLLL
jgi:hypothetical protein